MNTMNEKLERLRELFKGDCFAMKVGCQIDDVQPGYAKCSLDITQDHLNSMGNVMGGVSFTLADFTAAVAANQDQIGLVALDANITYLGRAKGTRLIAEARRLKDGRTTDYYQVTVQDDLGNLVTAGSITVFDTTAVK